jgi:hypothetical protein
LRFEDVLSSPEVSIRTIESFLGLQHDSSVIEFAKTIVKPEKSIVSKDFQMPLGVAERTFDLLKELGYT